MGGDVLRLGLVLVHRFVGEVQGELVPTVGAGDFPDVQDALVDDDIRTAAVSYTQLDVYKRQR